jgi:hypothetical protein
MEKDDIDFYKKDNDVTKWTARIQIDYVRAVLDLAYIPKKDIMDEKF